MTFNKAIYDTLESLAHAAENAETVEEYNSIIEEGESLVLGAKEYIGSVIETECEYLKVDPTSKNFYLHYNDQTSDVAMPQALVDRIIYSQDKGVDFMPLVRMWVRFLRNPNLNKEGKGASFGEKFFNFVNMKYVHPKLKEEFMEDHGLTEDAAEERATMYQMKITKEGLLNGYKVSREIEYKYETDEDGERCEVPRYARTFNPDTGEIDSDGKPEHVEDRLFEPSIMGKSGDAFGCEGPNGYDSAGHFIKVGCKHSLDSWDMVDINDNRSCVPGLHVGGLKYIAWYAGEIHNVFIDPMHVGAVPDDVDGAIRCKEYFVHSSLVGVNGSIYHSSTYAKATDEQWKEMLQEAVVVHIEAVEKQTEDLKRLQSLV
tara:strand:- start:2442 stop:3560 length:1119 start_codon:yes stop_codon:yes gene_type:complete